MSSDSSRASATAWASGVVGAIVVVVTDATMDDEAEKKNKNSNCPECKDELLLLLAVHFVRGRKFKIPAEKKFRAEE